MARNAIQFQKRLSEVAYQENYGTEAQCETVWRLRAGQMASSAQNAALPRVIDWIRSICTSAPAVADRLR